MKHAGLATVVAIAIAAAVGAGVARYQGTRSQVELKSGTALPEPRAVADFALTDQRGRPFTHGSLEGQWTLLFTGFTNCPDVCPTTLALLAQLRRDVARDDIQYLFVSVDPERDTPEAIARYLGHFDPAIVGATGTRAETERFTAGLGLAQVRNPGVGNAYTVDHSTALVLVDPRGRLAGYFQAPHALAPLTADLAALPK